MRAVIGEVITSLPSPRETDLGGFCLEQASRLEADPSEAARKNAALALALFATGVVNNLNGLGAPGTIEGDMNGLMVFTTEELMETLEAATAASAEQAQRVEQLQQELQQHKQATAKWPLHLSDKAFHALPPEFRTKIWRDVSANEEAFTAFLQKAWDYKGLVDKTRQQLRNQAVAPVVPAADPSDVARLQSECDRLNRFLGKTKEDHKAQVVQLKHQLELAMSVATDTALVAERDALQAELSQVKADAAKQVWLLNQALEKVHAAPIGADHRFDEFKALRKAIAALEAAGLTTGPAVDGLRKQMEDLLA